MSRKHPNDETPVITPDNVADPLPVDETSEVVNMPVFNLSHGGTVYVDPEQVTHIIDRPTDNPPGCTVGTTGGITLNLNHPADEIAHTFGWIE
jgi:hypothetical protein